MGTTEKPPKPSVWARIKTALGKLGEKANNATGEDFGSRK